MIARKSAAVLGIFLLTATMVAAQASKLDGTWEGKWDHEGRLETLTFEFHAKGDALTGKVFREGEEFGDIADVKLDGSKISFKVDVIAFDGTFDKDTLKLTITLYNGNKVPINASRKKTGS
jgi:hypothetical protein